MLFHLSGLLSIHFWNFAFWEEICQLGLKPLLAEFSVAHTADFLFKTIDIFFSEFEFFILNKISFSVHVLMFYQEQKTNL